MIVYLITNLKNGKRYVGLDRNKTKRWPDHLRRSKLPKPVQLIDRKIAQHGRDNFMYEVLCECLTIEELKEREVYYIATLDTFVGNGKGYNLTLGGDGCVGFKMPEEKINKGEKHYMFGKKQPEETNRKRSETMKKVRANTVNPFTTPDVRRKVSEAAKKRTGKLNPNYKHGKRMKI